MYTSQTSFLFHYINVNMMIMMLGVAPSVIKSACDKDVVPKNIIVVCLVAYILLHDPSSENTTQFK